MCPTGGDVRLQVLPYGSGKGSIVSSIQPRLGTLLGFAMLPCSPPSRQSPYPHEYPVVELLYMMLYISPLVTTSQRSLVSVLFNSPYTEAG